MFVEAAIKIFAHAGIKVITTNEGFVSTPMISLATVKLKASLGVVITASHNPPDYNGYKLKGDFGGPLLPENVDEIERIMGKHRFDIAEIQYCTYGLLSPKLTSARFNLAICRYLNRSLRAHKVLQKILAHTIVIHAFKK